MDTNNLYIQFGIFIKNGRTRKELYQKEVAERVGVSQAYYSQIESGTRQATMSVALSICQELGLDFNEFLRSLNKKKASVNRP